MPREASKCRGWEKERRNRLNEGFATLAKVLPCYDPSVNLSKIEILLKATCTIKDLQTEVDKIISPGTEKTPIKDDIVRKLQERIKKLIVRNDQLNNLLKDAGISVPKVVGTVKNFSGKRPWSRRISPGQAKVLQKNEMEKENISAKLAQDKKKKVRAAKANVICKRPMRSDKKSDKVNTKRRRIGNAPASTSCVFVLSQPTAGGLNQQCYIIANPGKASTKSHSNPPGLQPSPIINATVPFINSIKPSLGPGTLILANGTVVPILSQSQVIISQPSFVSKPVTLSNVHLPKQSGSNNEKLDEKIVNVESKKHSAIRPKPCVTKTTQVNKVPIPALTSPYANTYYFLSESSEKKIETITKKNPRKINGNSCGVKRKAVKEKSDAGVDSKKSKNSTIESTTISELKAGSEKPSKNNQTVSISEASINNIATSEATVTSTNTAATTSGLATTANVPTESKLSESVVPISSSDTSNSYNVPKDNSTKLVLPELLITETKPSSQHDITNDQKTIHEGPEQTSNEKSSIENDLCNESASTFVPSTRSTDICTSNEKHSVSADVHADTIKNLELNLEHSELSNDIFSSLQVPPGCQNPESTSPTAAFLLAFPLVSSVKVSEAIEEENSESQRETPTLLQIGTMDSTKSKHADSLASGLLALEGFSFFNNKDVYGNHISSYSTPGEKENKPGEKPDSSSKPTEDVKDSSFRISEQFTIEEMVQSRSNRLAEHPPNTDSDIRGNYEKQSEVLQGGESSPVITKTESLHNQFSGNVQSSISKNSDDKCPGPQLNDDKPENISYHHDILHKNLKEKMDNERTMCEKQFSDIIKENNQMKSAHGNVRPEQVVFRQSEENNHSGVFHKKTDDIVDAKSSKVCGSADNIVVPHVNEFEGNIKVCQSISLNSNNNSSNISHSQEKNTNLSRERSDNSSIVSRNGHTSISNICHEIGATHNTSHNTSGTNFRIINKNILNEFPYIYESKMDVSKKIVQDININEFSANNIPKDNKLDNFNMENANSSIHSAANSMNSKNINYSMALTNPIIHSASNPKDNSSTKFNMVNINPVSNSAPIPKDNTINNFKTSNINLVSNSSSNPNDNKIIDFNTSDINHLSNSTHNPKDNTIINFKTNNTHLVGNSASNPNDNKIIDFNTANINHVSNSAPNPKDNKNIQFNMINTNAISSEPLLDKAHSLHYNSFHSKSNRIEMAFSNSIQNYNENTTTSKLPENTHFNPFEMTHANTPKDISVNLNNTTEKIVNPRNIDSNINSKTTVDHLQHHKKSNETYLKNSGQKQQCYFSTSYPDNSCNFNYTTDMAKICPTCSYMNLNKNGPNPLYTNCNNHNYNYSETNFNQNYYKPAISSSETKPYYTLNYENYQEHRKMDMSTFTPKCYGNTPNYAKDKKVMSDKEKCHTQNKPVNWMTTPDNRVQPPEPFLPTYASQSYSFASCNTGEASDINSIVEHKKTDLLPLVPEDKQFSWSPTKLPNFLDSSANFVTPTLPTLVGDLALGNPLTFGEHKQEYKYPKETKRKGTAYENHGNFLSVSQLVDHNKAENVPARISARRNSGNRSKNSMQVKHKKSPKTEHDKVSHAKPIANNYNMLGASDMFYEQKNRNLPKSMSSSYSAEALIGNQITEVPKKYHSNSIKPVGSSNFLTENIINYFPAVDDSYMSQNQNMLHSFQNNTYNTNTFVYTTPTISSTHVTSNFEAVGHEYSQENFLNVPNSLKDNKTCPNKNYRPSNKDDKNVNYSINGKRTRKKQTYDGNNSSFDYPLLSMPGSTNSPILPDDFHAHTNFIPPTTPYPSKNAFYQRQGNEFNSNPLLPLTGLHRNNIQQLETPSSMNVAGTSLTNFNLSTIFPEINKGAVSNIYPDNRNKEHSTSQQVPFNVDSKYTFPG